MRSLIKLILIITLLSCNERKISSNQNSNMSNMAGKSFTTSITVDKDISSTFNSIKNFRAWWSEEIKGKTDQLNETFFYHYKDVHLCKINLIVMIADKKLVYIVIVYEFNFS